MEVAVETKSIENINFNALAWEAPRHGEDFGYSADDIYFNEIIAWLKTGEIVWDNNGKVEHTKRLRNCRGTDGNYDVKATWNKDTKLINWYFIKPGVYEV